MSVFFLVRLIAERKCFQLVRHFGWQNEKASTLDAGPVAVNSG
jgi:hypothetical protein